MSDSGLRAKYVRRFHILDFAGDGYVDRSDVEARAQRLLDGMAEPAETPRAAAVREGAVAFWLGLAKLAGVQDSDRLDQEAFVGALLRARELGTIGDLVGPSVEAHVALVDSDGDGSVSLAEFLRSQSASGMAEADSRQAFEQLDRNGDGRLDVEEWQRAVVDFYTSDSEDQAGALIMDARA
ncbi:EF-hand domain-containing protein [Streptomyces sp. NPDC050147]|uniref:EF-hand domain-containing protein n=1 Tax=Streptomyces sp. NPDC050147 TaxID=3155513 RepID=UPI00343FC8DF